MISIKDIIEVDNLNIEIRYKTDNEIYFKDIVLYKDINGQYINGRLSGTGSVIYRKEILQAINTFKSKL